MTSTTVSNDVARDKAARLLQRKGPGSVASSQDRSIRHYRQRAESVSTLSYAEEPGQYEMLRPPVRFENTYQLKPTKTFPSGQVELIIKDVLEGCIGNEQYNPDFCRNWTKSISEVVRSRVKELSLPRYKIICLVHIGQLADQGMRVASRCLWDSSCDTFASYSLKNNSLFALCTVYGVYHD